jgi:hypothetical protein
MQELFRKLIQFEPNLPDSTEEGIRQVCLGRYAFMTTLHLISWQHVTCEVVALPGESFPVSMTIALTKNSPYKEVINYK